MGRCRFFCLMILCHNYFLPPENFENLGIILYGFGYMSISNSGEKNRTRSDSFLKKIGTLVLIVVSENHAENKACEHSSEMRPGHYTCAHVLEAGKN